MTVTTNTTLLPLRNDTLLGVCEGLGQEFGINPNWLRLAFVLPLFVQPMLTMAAYFAVGGVLALARWLIPTRVAVEAPAALAAPAADNREQDDYKIAA